MSRVRGVLPLFVATGFGIINGLYVFGPAFKEESIVKQEKDRQELVSLGVTQSKEGEVKQLAQAEAAASRNKATEEIRYPNTAPKTKSWWPNLGLWSKDEQPSAPKALNTKSKQSTSDTASTQE